MRWNWPSTCARANLEIPQGQSPADRTDVVDVVLSLSNPLRLAIDPIGGKLYWSNYVGAQKIQRSDLSGGNVEDVVTQLNTPDGIAVDSTCGKIYWAESGSNGDRIRRANPDGSSVEDLVLLPESGNGPVGVELDVASRVLYWSDNGADCIRRAGMEIPPGQTAATRTDIETLVAGLANPTGLALDLSQPAPGDINGDGGLDADDLPSLVARLLNP
jgi:DNA-binding beta-propeller fold protein YncE